MGDVLYKLDPRAPASFVWAAAVMVVVALAASLFTGSYAAHRSGAGIAGLIFYGRAVSSTGVSIALPSRTTLTTTRSPGFFARSA